VLSLVASTPTENSMLDIVLQNGYLSTVKLWMDDILKGTLGEFDKCYGYLCPITAHFYLVCRLHVSQKLFSVLFLNRRNRSFASFVN
jgi:hypothetical protein